jgi:hypothetical protein
MRGAVLYVNLLVQLEEISAYDYIGVHISTALKRVLRATNLAVFHVILLCFSFKNAILFMENE